MINPLWLLGQKRLRRRVRCLLITLDGVGCGALPDAAEFGDEGVNTLAHVAEAAGGLKLPNLGALGLGNILPLAGVPPVPRPQALFGKLAERSRGKDTTVGHWELMGVVTSKAFPVYPDGFPAEVIEEFERVTGRGVIGNIPASGTQIIRELGEEHLRTGALIVYTSADSVFQIAAHEDIVPVEELYEILPPGAGASARRKRGRARHRAAVHGSARRLHAHAAAAGISPWCRRGPTSTSLPRSACRYTASARSRRSSPARACATSTRPAATPMASGNRSS